MSTRVCVCAVVCVCVLCVLCINKKYFALVFGTWLLSQLFSDCSLILVAFSCSSCCSCSLVACDKLAWLTFVRCCQCRRRRSRRRRRRRLLLFFNKLVILLNYSSSRTPTAHLASLLPSPSISKLCLLALAAAPCDYIGLSMWR